MQYSPKPVGYYNTPNNQPINYEIDLSIIVPMYNVEKYIEECLLSILNSKTRFKFEIICIDDGSLDSSYAIAQKIQQLYGEDKLKIFRQENRGFSGARNRGIDEAIGKYIMFVDSDDKIDSEMIEILLSEAISTKHNIVSCGFYNFNENGIVREHIEKDISCDNNSEFIMKKYPSYITMKIFERDVWNEIRLPEGYWFEDMIGLYILPKLCKGFSYVSKPLYWYRQNYMGISATAPKRIKSIDQFWMTEYIDEECDRLSFTKDFTYYKAMLKELGSFLYNRTKNIDLNIRKTVFSAAADKVATWDLNIKDKNLSKSEKRVLKAFFNKDFPAWEIASKYWY